MTAVPLAMESSPISEDFPVFRLLQRREIVAVALALGVFVSAYLLPADLGTCGRVTLSVTVLSIIGWTMTRMPDVVVAVLAAVMLVIFDCLPADALDSALGHPMIWLMLSAFVIAAALTASGAAEHLAISATRPFRSVRGLFYGVMLVIFATAFAIPSTSGRAALLLPVFVALSMRLPDVRLKRAFALLFPTIILLSAGASLIGAGAHVVAADTIAEATGQAVTLLGWSALTLPLSLLACLIAVELLLLVFTKRETRQLELDRSETGCGRLSVTQRILFGILIGTIGLWATMPLHGLSLVTVALMGVVATLSTPLAGVRTKDLFRKVNVELLVFVAAAMVLAQSMRHTKTDEWLADVLLAALPQDLTGSKPAVYLLAATAALLFHLAVTSRSARAAVLLPALAIPLAGLGHDLAVLALIVVLGTGFCQTLPASAKPVALFSGMDDAAFERRDLLRLALVLGPVILALIMLFALHVWPHQFAAIRGAG